MGFVLLRSTDQGRSWKSIENFPAVPNARDNAEGRYLTAHTNGTLIVTWGIGSKNKGLRYSVSTDDGQTWSDTVTLLPETDITARYYSARTIPLDDEHVGTVFMNRKGVHFLKVRLDSLAK